MGRRLTEMVLGFNSFSAEKSYFMVAVGIFEVSLKTPDTQQMSCVRHSVQGVPVDSKHLVSSVLLSSSITGVLHFQDNGGELGVMQPQGDVLGCLPRSQF